MKGFEVNANGGEYQIRAVCGEWYVTKADGGRLYYFAGFDGQRPMWSSFFNFLFALSFEKALDVLDSVRGCEA
jgi:hypothetical protein